MTYSSNRNDKSLILAATAASVLTVAAIVSYRNRQKKKERPSLERSWSFTSEGMRLGVFPPQCNAPPTLINAAMYFDSSEFPTEEAFVEQMVAPLLKYDRFSKVPTDNGLKEVPLQAKDLVRTVEFRGGEKELHATIYKMLLDSFPPEKPLWEVVRVANQNKQERSVMLLRVHHCLGDGLSLIKAFDEVLTSVDGGPTESKVTKALISREFKLPPISSILSAVCHVLTLPASKHDDDTAIFKQDLTYSGNRTVQLLPEVPLQYIKDCKQAAPLPATINDILTCAISQALHEYCQRHGDAKLLNEKGTDLQCRALLPISLPRSKSSPPLQNRFCMVSADLSVGESSLTKRLEQIHQTTTFLKQSPRAFVQLWIQNNIVGSLPVAMARQTAHDIFSRHSLVLTNVPGPEQQCVLAGAKVKGLQLLFPNVLPQVDLITYAGTVYGNLIYDPDDWKQGDQMIALYAKALVDLGKAFGVSDIPKGLVEMAKKV